MRLFCGVAVIQLPGSVTPDRRIVQILAADSRCPSVAGGCGDLFLAEPGVRPDEGCLHLFSGAFSPHRRMAAWATPGEGQRPVLKAGYTSWSRGAPTERGSGMGTGKGTGNGSDSDSAAALHLLNLQDEARVDR